MNLRQGFRLLTVRGIPIRIHVTFLLVLPFLAYAFGQSFSAAARMAGVPEHGLSGSPWAWGLLVALALFASVLVHELAHSLYASSHGGKVRSITLLMIGGVSELSEVPRRPAQEAWMALAGPASSLAVAGASFALLRALEGVGSFDARFGLYLVGQLNLMLGIFNLLPAFPMDGGRVLRALLVRSRGRVQATRIAATVGKASAGLFGVAGLLSGNILLVLVAFFVFIGAEAEQHAEMARAALGDMRVAELMTAPMAAIGPGDTLYDAGERMIREKRIVLPVVDSGRVVGTLSAEAIERIRLDERKATFVGRVMGPAAAVAPGERVAELLLAFAEYRTPELAVVEGGRLVGTVSHFDVSRALRLHELLASQHPASGLTPREQAT
jgi:Zn-dependent protease/predicted transcriptional regulator